MTDDELIDAGFDSPVEVEQLTRSDPFDRRFRQPLWLIGVVTRRDGSPCAVIENASNGAIGVLPHTFLVLKKPRDLCRQM